MFNDLFWFSMVVAAFGSTALVAVGIALPACPTGPSLDRPAGTRRARLGRA